MLDYLASSLILLAVLASCYRSALTRKGTQS